MRHHGSLLAAIAVWVLCSYCRAELRVVIPADACPAVRFAANEFAGYHGRITGTTPVVDTQKRGGGPFVTIVADETGFTGETDAYRVSSCDDGLAIVGRNGRSAIYAVYDFYRTKCGCRWFWDGDVVPPAPRVDLAGVDMTEQSRFAYRACQYFAHRSLRRFQAELWSFDDWKREIDWALKSRLNVIMLQTGIEDIFQLAFPDVVPYPDVSVTEVPDAKPGYNYRTPFWSLQFRHLLRKAVLDYAAERGLMHPTVFGPRTHWYSRTPKAFMEKMKPDPMPQEVDQYSEPSGRLWDVRQKKWRDMYWKMTEASIANYGYSGLLFDPGFDERMVYTNREANVRLKIDLLQQFNREAAARHPDATLLIEGWDFFGQWRPEEVRQFTSVADPSRTVFWNYTSDEDDMQGQPDIPKHNNFMQWGLTNAFPYVFGSMLALNRGSDVRFNLPQVRAREAVIRDDPMCRGYALWPEMSHSDIFAWWYFAESCWGLTPGTREELLTRFCRDRYGERADEMRPAWRLVLDFGYRIGWDGNFTDAFMDWYEVDGYAAKRNEEARWRGARAVLGEKYVDIPAARVFGDLAKIDWRGTFVRRDTIDLARTTMDRVIRYAFEDLMKDYYDVRRGERTVAAFKAEAVRFTALMRCFAEVLALHADYSVAETLAYVDAVEKLRNPKAEHLLFMNSACGYCRGYQVEHARGIFVPLADEMTALLVARAEAGDFSPLPPPTDYQEKLCRTEHPILAFAPDPAQRTEEAYARVMAACAAACGDRTLGK